MGDWQGRVEIRAVEYEVEVPGRPDPVAVIRRVRQREGRDLWRVVTWARTSAERVLIGRWADLDDAAVAAWRYYVDSQASRHEAVSRMHGGRERGGLREA